MSTARTPLTHGAVDETRWSEFDAYIPLKGDDPLNGAVFVHFLASHETGARRDHG